jgi:phage tail sheath protein FI
MIGVTRSGVIGVAQKVSSWTEFIAKYANGLDTPFLENSYLPYSVYGFFSNGGKELYIGSVKKDAKKASKTSTANQIEIEALTEGVWGNDLKIAITKSVDDEKAVDITITLGSSDSVTISEVTVADAESSILANSKAKNWIGKFSIGSTIEELKAETISLEGGTDGTQLTDNDYVDALSMIDVLDEVTLVAIPGQTSKVVNDAIMSYCDNNGLFPIIDMPVGSTAEATKTYRKSISAWTGALAHPWGKVSDPLTNGYKLVPTAGHVMGVYARIIESRGIHKAPAGVDAVVRGFIEMEYQLTPTQIASLNPIGVICITSRPNAGIVLWGARSLNSSDSTLRYVTDGLLNLNIKKSLYDGTQFAVFEPNDESLWSRVQATCKAFLETLRTQGALKGTADEAYYVTVDDTNNTDDTIADGQLNIEIGYAPVKPAEFVIIKLAHSIES